MNKRIIIVGLVIILAGVGLVVFNQSQPTPTEQSATTQQNASPTEPTNNGQDTTATDSSKYTIYSQEAFTASADTKRVLFFYANWCPTCRPTDADFRQNAAQIPEGVTVLRVNYNDPDTDQEEKELAQKYGITYQHTFVQIDGEGNPIKKWNGGQLEELLAQIQ